MSNTNKCFVNAIGSHKKEQHMTPMHRPYLPLAIAGAMAILYSLNAAGQASGDSIDGQPLITDGIDCRGNVITSCDFIRDRLYLKVNERIDEEELANAKLRLSSLPNFRSVNVRLEKGSERGRARVVIEVTENDPWTKESVAVLASRDSIAYVRVAGRISNENLFGTGKLLSLQAGSLVYLNKVDGNDYYARLQYADPRLFNSHNYFLVGGVFYDKVSLRAKDSRYEFERDILGADLTVGRRLFDFSYVTIGYQYYPDASAYEQVELDDGTLAIGHGSDSTFLQVSYGWNTEDDTFFPTRGSRFQVLDSMRTSDHDHYLSAGYRQSWKFGRGVWTLKLGTAPGVIYRSSLEPSYDFAVAYSWPVALSGQSSLVRGRWYVEPGGESPSAHVWEVGIKAGVRLESQSLGHINLYIFGASVFREGGNE